MLQRSKVFSGVMFAMVMMAAFAVAVLGDEAITRIEGKGLYQKNCSGCHGDLEDSAKAGRSMNRIRTAIRTVHQSKELAALSDDQILLIALALKDIEN